jgi:hypothetical protein
MVQPTYLTIRPMNLILLFGNHVKLNVSDDTYILVAKNTITFADNHMYIIHLS